MLGLVGAEVVVEADEEDDDEEVEAVVVVGSVGSARSSAGPCAKWQKP